MDIKYVKRENASHCEDGEHLAISSSVRSARPGNYLFQIEAFPLLLQLLVKTKSDKYDSNHFEAGGYKWKLSLYPNGDTKRGGDGYISLYLVMADPESLPQGWEVNAIFKFFVFDHVHDNYLILQDGKEKRFHAMKREWGFPKLLPLNVFNDASNGYLIDGSCAFGVEIFVHKNEWKTESLRIINEPSNRSSCTWKVEKFSTLTEEFYNSDTFTVGGCKWILKLYPKGHSRTSKHLSLGLNIGGLSNLPCGWNIYAEYKLSIKDQLIGNDYDYKDNSWFSVSAQGWCYWTFMPLSELNDASRGFIVNDTVIVEGKITFMSVVNS